MSKSVEAKEWLHALLSDIADIRQAWETSSGEPMAQDAKNAIKYLKELESLSIQQEADAKDAARYRWLRESNVKHIHVIDGRDGFRCFLEGLDSRIDNALATPTDSEAKTSA